jgi:transposase
VRLNDSSYKGWVKCRTMLAENLATLAARARPQIAAAIKAEREYLAGASDEELVQKNPHATRGIMTKRLAELEALLGKSG